MRTLQRQLEALLKKFKEEGGFTENLTQTRMIAAREAALNNGNPLCPKCGKPMAKRLIKKGSRQGQEFWGCTSYPNCDGTRPI